MPKSERHPSKWRRASSHQRNIRAGQLSASYACGYRVHLWLSAADPKGLTQRDEFRIALDIGDEIEHLNGVVANAALVAEHGQGFADLLRSALAGLYGFGAGTGAAGASAGAEGALDPPPNCLS